MSHDVRTSPRKGGARLGARKGAAEMEASPAWRPSVGDLVFVAHRDWGEEYEYTIVGTYAWV